LEYFIGWGRFFIVVKKSFAILLCISFLMITDCGGGRNLVVLVPDPDGSVGSITVSNEAGSTVLDLPNQATTIKDRKSEPEPPTIMEKEEIDSIFSKALAIQPASPAHIILYFEKDSTELTPDSMNLLPHIFETVRKRNALNISVVGHSDTSGNEAYNLKLSKRRALSVTDLLIKKGIPKEIIETTSHGEKNPLIKTGDNVNEPRNRRVEVVIR